jgi:Flp pilus assembly pilin Flp
MFNAFLARLYLMLETVVAVMAGHLRGRTSAVAGARGVTFIEYALLAAIAVIIAVLFRSQLSAAFNAVFGSLRGITG